MTSRYNHSLQIARGHPIYFTCTFQQQQGCVHVKRNRHIRGELRYLLLEADRMYVCMFFCMKLFMYECNDLLVTTFQMRIFSYLDLVHHCKTSLLALAMWDGHFTLFSDIMINMKNSVEHTTPPRPNRQLKFIQPALNCTPSYVLLICLIFFIKIHVSFPGEIRENAKKYPRGTQNVIMVLSWPMCHSSTLFRGNLFWYFLRNPAYEQTHIWTLWTEAKS